MVYLLVLSEYPSIFTLTYHIGLDRTLDVSQSCLFQVATYPWNSSGKKRNLFSTFKLWIVGLLLERSQSGQNLGKMMHFNQILRSSKPCERSEHSFNFDFEKSGTFLKCHVDSFMTSTRFFRRS